MRALNSVLMSGFLCTSIGCAPVITQHSYESGIRVKTTHQHKTATGCANTWPNRAEATLPYSSVTRPSDHFIRVRFTAYRQNAGTPIVSQLKKLYFAGGNVRFDLLETTQVISAKTTQNNHVDSLIDHVTIGQELIVSNVMPNGNDYDMCILLKSDSFGELMYRKAGNNTVFPESTIDRHLMSAHIPLDKHGYSYAIHDQNVSITIELLRE